MRHTAFEILLIRKDKHQAIGHFQVTQNAVQLYLGFLNAVVIGRVDNEDETLGACIAWTISSPP